MVNKDKQLKTLGDLCLEVYTHLGGLNFDEKDFQVAVQKLTRLWVIDYKWTCNLKKPA